MAEQTATTEYAKTSNIATKLLLLTNKDWYNVMHLAGSTEITSIFSGEDEIIIKFKSSLGAQEFVINKKLQYSHLIDIRFHSLIISPFEPTDLHFHSSTKGENANGNNIDEYYYCYAFNTSDNDCNENHGTDAVLRHNKCLYCGKQHPIKDSEDASIKSIKEKITSTLSLTTTTASSFSPKLTKRKSDPSSSPSAVQRPSQRTKSPHPQRRASLGEEHPITFSTDPDIIDVLPHY